MSGVKLVISDKASGLVEVLGDFFPEAKWQRCIVHWYRNAFSKCPSKHVREVTAMLKAIHAQEDKKRLGKKQNPLWKNCRQRSWMELQNL